MARRTSLAVSTLLALAAPAYADLRSFTRTYEFTTQPAGASAVEVYHTQGRATWDANSPQFFEEQVEIEHGITDYWDFAFYTVFKQVAGDAMTSQPFHLDGVKLRTRYRLADRGEWPVDTLLYFEIEKEFGASVYTFEGKVILARDFDKFTAAFNAIAETKVGNDVDEIEPEFGFAAGLTYQAHPKIRVGAETWGALEGGELELSAGPAVSFSASPKLWTAITAGFGLSDADKFVVRAIIGIEL